MASEENQNSAESESSQSLSLVQSQNSQPSLDQLRSFAQSLAQRLPYLQFSRTRTLDLPSEHRQNSLLPSPQEPETEIQQPQQAQQPQRNGLSMLIPLLTALARQQGQRGGQTHMVVFFNQATGSVMVFEGTSEEFGFPWEKRGPLPASKAAIEAMARVEVEESGKECSICLEEYGVGETVREMPCKHCFHGGCIEKWLTCHGSCPVCRYAMPVDEESEETKSVNVNGNGDGDGDGGGGGLTVHAFFIGGGGGAAAVGADVDDGGTMAVEDLRGGDGGDLHG